MERQGSDFGLRGYPYEMFSRHFDALEFQSIRRKSGTAYEKKICISACGRKEEWDDCVYGCTRVAVYGADSLCVAVRTIDLERVICHAQKACHYMCELIMVNALIFEAEDLTLPPGDVSKMTSQRFDKPFVVVSLAPGPNGGHEASSEEYQADSAINFLKEEFSSGTTFTIGESVKTAICTLQNLFGQELKANEIKVYYVDDYKGRVLGQSVRGEPVKQIQMHRKRAIKDHVAVINKVPSSKGISNGIRSIFFPRHCSLDPNNMDIKKTLREDVEAKYQNEMLQHESE